MSEFTHSALNGDKAALVAALFHRFQQDPNAVDPAWRRFFGELDSDARSLIESFKPNGGGEGAGAVAESLAHGANLTAEHVRAATLDSIRALMMIRAYRVRGHLEADLDPLGLREIEPHPELDPKNYGFTDEDMDRPIFVNHVLGFETATLRRIMQRLRSTYCGKIGVEYMHIQEPDQKAWIQERIENIDNRTEFTERGRKAILERLSAAEAFEVFLDKKYTGTKRFGIDGGESMIPALEQILKRGGQMGLKEVVIGMPHRGRLNVLASFMGKPYRAIFHEFQGGAAHPEDIGGSGDVKYHLGTSSDREFDGNWVHLSLTANPSHLEAVNPVCVGKVRAKQLQRGDTDRTEVACLLLHGDAAFAGQGLVPETLDLSELRGYRIGGTVHFVVNNQIGFTTNPVHARSGPYCTEVAKMIQAPIFHVNGDDPEAVVHVARIATEFRQTFKKDVVIDMFCYRRYGHNEGDEPSFTQPIMYDAIKKHPRVRKLYADRLVNEGVLSAEEADGDLKRWQETLQEEFDAASTYRPNKADWLEGVWSGFARPKDYGARRGDTGVDTDTLKKVGRALAHVPDDVNVHRKIKRLLDTKAKMIESGEGIDWATAEALAFGTLAVEGHPVRLSGQDSGRGTFSQRHAVLVDQNTERRYVPLNNIDPEQASFEVVDSPLSEAGVVGFEYGFSLAEPRALVLWEAQFGDFVNGAQVIIDQFIASGEVKWLRMSGLVMLLPHGYEGQGPEHSSARIERFLQLCAEDNLQIVNCSTPANFFHALRRQLHREFRKPLVIFTPKSLLRHKRCVSRLEDFGEDSSFHRVLYEDNPPSKPAEARQVVMCSGKVYYDLIEEREKRGITDIHILRMEQLYPFPADAVAAELEPYKHCDIVWCQEEPRNMGPWAFIETFIEEIATEVGFAKPRPRYAGRRTAASPATGVADWHKRQQAQLLDEALTVGLPRMSRIQTRKADEAARTGEAKKASGGSSKGNGAAGKAAASSSAAASSGLGAKKSGGRSGSARSRTKK
ncbi:2-oxoglutarate dehydrogenase E1 component [Ferruginivarius sediminum]|uniref:2-oxoglutarate dehydrogenase E1 component n=1 Tax=Ferruginivarius sediminum TaxID=2661937 RepID=A0A369TAA5_9PROT|nr:2-oxoglutarate dehydrogenase E1 component [Ferruginivarius sediminum]RDD62208.1 2-oxoglutarate dehydrogenase E1 component [Ferruginivarius sediminum]